MTVTQQDMDACSVHLSQDESAVVILDQTLLPNETKYLNLRTPQEIYDAIKCLAVRGAPAIGICAGYAMYVLAQQKAADDFQTLFASLKADGDFLISSRPTAVNLSWAVKRMLAKAEENCALPVPEVVKILGEESKAIHREDIEMCYRIAEYGLSLVKPGDGILTHCNAGPLATSKYGTATGPMFLGKERGIDFHVFSDETRPLLQGARLTSYELQKAGIDVTLICDNMASMVMKNGWVQGATVSRQTGTLPTRSVLRVWLFWPSTTEYRSTRWGRLRRSTFRARPAMISRSSCGIRTRFALCGTKNRWRCPR